MSKKEIDPYYSDLISRYLSKNTSASEVEELEAWVLADPQHKDWFMASKKAWILSGMKENGQNADLDTYWKKTEKELFDQEVGARVIDMNSSSGRIRWIGIAAAIAFLVVAVIWFFPRSGQEDPLYIAAKEEVQAIDLSDGSQVTLNQSTSIEFIAQSEVGERTVSLKGDAFFDVARDEKHPFVIETQGLEIEVLGTSFYVDARPDQEDVQVIVESGRVAVRFGEKEEILTASEKAVFSKTDQSLTKLVQEDPNHLALKTNELVFKDTRLEEVVFILNRQFRAKISIESESLKSCPLSATFKDKALASILKSIEKTFEIEVQETGDRIVLKGECNQ